MRALFVTAAALAISPAAAFADACPKETTRYTLSRPEPARAHVEIDHQLASQTFAIAAFTARDGTTNQSLISKVEMSGPNGSGRMTDDGQGRWQAEDVKIGDRVRITYDLSLTQGDHPWPFGAEEVGTTFETGAYLVSRTALMADYGAPDCPIEIVFKTQQSAAPWTETAPGRYRAESVRDLHDNGFAFGDQVSRFTADTDQGRVTFVHDEPSTPLAEEAAKDTARMIAHLTDLFGGFPASNYHIFLFEGQQPEGGAFYRSFAMLHPVPAQPVDAIIWRHGFIHEIIHLWLGHSVRPASGADIEWFKEGFTDYLAIKTLWRLGFIDDHTLAEKFENLLRRHTLGFLLSQGNVKLSEAGANKSQNRMTIYGSGAVLALLLDAQLSDDKGPGAFEAMLAKLYQQSSQPYSQERLLDFLDAETNGGASRLLADFDTGLMPHQIAPMLEEHGVEMAFMIPDLFQLDLNPRRCSAPGCLPAFLQKAQ